MYFTICRRFAPKEGRMTKSNVQQNKNGRILVDKILTITVPSYNTEAYIDECIPTMLQHPYVRYLEILLVNDGSSDRTLEKMEWYQRRYPDTIVVIDKENAGHGSAVNLGIQRAKGIYFKVIDGDDQVLSQNLAKMMEQLSRCQADLVIHPYIKWHAYTKKRRIVRYPLPAGRELLFDEVAGNLKEVEIHAATYRTALLRDNQIQVRERCFYEDTEYNIFPVRYIRTVCAFRNPVYLYRIGTAAQSIHPKQAFAHRQMHHRIIADCIAYDRKYSASLSKGKRDYIRRIICKRIRSHYMIYIKNPMTESRMRELLRWDSGLKEASPLLYQASHRFPICVMRKNIRRMYPFVKAMYGVYARLFYRLQG